MSIAADVIAQKRLNENIRYGRVNGVSVWVIDDIQSAYRDGHLQQGEEEFRKRLSDSTISTVAIIFGDTSPVGRKLIEHIDNTWEEIKDEVGIEKTAYVGSGIESYTIASLQSEHEVKVFNDINIAVQWLSSSNED